MSVKSIVNYKLEVPTSNHLTHNTREKGCRISCTKKVMMVAIGALMFLSGKLALTNSGVNTSGPRPLEASWCVHYPLGSWTDEPSGLPYEETALVVGSQGNCFDVYLDPNPGAVFRACKQEDGSATTSKILMEYDEEFPSNCGGYSKPNKEDLEKVPEAAVVTFFGKMALVYRSGVNFFGEIISNYRASN